MERGSLGRHHWLLHSRVAMLSSLLSKCPHCSAEVQVADTAIGKTVRCPGCEQSFAVASVKLVAGATNDTSPLAMVTLDSQPQGAAAPPAADHRRAVKERLGRFELKGLLGQGGFGCVYRAYDPQLDRDVALKVPTFGPEDKHKVQRFLTEAKSAARLRHPHIVTTYESGESGRQYYLVTQFVKGQTLSQRIKTQPPDFRQAAEWTRQLAEALAYAHSEGIVHRDVKPDNIMLDDKNRPQIMDFGLAKRVNEDASITTDGTILGTPAYMSPEQARGELASVGPASDQYSLGAVLYELLTGRRPFEGPPHAVIGLVASQEPSSPRSLVKSIPADLEAICQKAMSKDARQRYAAMSDMEEDLSRWLRGDETRARPITCFERAQRWRRRNPAVANLSLAIATLVLGFLVTLSIFVVQLSLARTKLASALTDVSAQRQVAEKNATDLKTANEQQVLTMADLKEERNAAKRAELLAATQRAAANQAKRDAEEALKVAQQRTTELEEANEKLRVTTNALKAREAELSAKTTEATASAREKQVLLATSYFQKGLELLGERDARSGLPQLVRALEEVPGDDHPDAVALRECIWMTLTAELASRPVIERQFSHQREIIGAQLHAGASRSGPAATATGSSFQVDTLDAGGRSRAWSPSSPEPTFEGPAYEFAAAPRLAVPLSPLHRPGAGLAFAVAYQDHPLEIVTWLSARQAREEPAASRGIKAAQLREADVVVGTPKVKAFHPRGSGQVVCLAFLTRTSGGYVSRVYECNFFGANAAWDRAGSEEMSDVLFGEHPSALVSYGRGGVVLWNAKSAAPVARFPREAVHVCASPPATAIVTVGTDKVYVLSGENLATLSERTETRPSVAAAISPGGRTLALAGATGDIQFQDLLTGQPLFTALGAVDRIRDLQWVQDRLLTTGVKEAACWKCPTMEELQTLMPGGRFGLLDDISPETRMVPASHSNQWVIAIRNKEVRFLSTRGHYYVTENGRQFPPLSHALPVRAAAWHASGAMAATAAGNAVRLWRVALPDNVFARRSPVPAELAELLAKSPTSSAREMGLPIRDPDDCEVTAVAFHPKEPLVFTGNARGQVRVWNLFGRAEPVAEWDVSGPAEAITAIVIDPGGEFGAFGTAGRAVVWDLKEQKQASAPNFTGSKVTSLALSVARKQLLVGMESGARLFSFHASQPPGKLWTHAKGVSAVAFHAGGPFACVVAGPGVHFYHLQTHDFAGQFVRDLPDDPSAAFNPAGDTVYLYGRAWKLPLPLTGDVEAAEQLVEAAVGSDLAAAP